VFWHMIYPFTLLSFKHNGMCSVKFNFCIQHLCFPSLRRCKSFPLYRWVPCFQVVLKKPRFMAGEHSVTESFTVFIFFWMLRTNLLSCIVLHFTHILLDCFHTHFLHVKICVTIFWPIFKSHVVVLTPKWYFLTGVFTFSTFALFYLITV